MQLVVFKRFLEVPVNVRVKHQIVNIFSNKLCHNDARFHHACACTRVGVNWRSVVDISVLSHLVYTQ